MLVAAAQIAPVLLDREAGLSRVLHWAEKAAGEGARLVAFPETVVPGYPTWLTHTGGAAFDDPDQKALHARYLDQAVELPGPDLDCRVALVLGIVESAAPAVA